MKSDGSVWSYYDYETTRGIPAEHLEVGKTYTFKEDIDFSKFAELLTSKGERAQYSDYWHIGSSQLYLELWVYEDRKESCIDVYPAGEEEIYYELYNSTYDYSQAYFKWFKWETTEPAETPSITYTKGLSQVWESCGLTVKDLETLVKLEEGEEIEEDGE